MCKNGKKEKNERKKKKKKSEEKTSPNNRKYTSCVPLLKDFPSDDSPTLFRLAAN
jgi:hypothetical protein